MNTKCFEAGQVIFNKGDYSGCMYDILSGSVGIYDAYATPDQKQIATLGAGQTLGEMGVVEVYPRSATAVALEPETELVQIEAGELEEYYRDKPVKLLYLMRQLSQRLRETNEKYADACRAVYEHEEAVKSGSGMTDWVKTQLDYCIEVYSSFRPY